MCLSSDQVLSKSRYEPAAHNTHFCLCITYYCVRVLYAARSKRHMKNSAGQKHSTDARQTARCFVALYG